MSVSGFSSTAHLTQAVANLNNTNPYTLWCWMNDSLANATQKYLMALASSNSAGAGLEVINGTARFATFTTVGRVTSANTYSAGAWNGVGGVSRSNTDRSVYLNGTRTNLATSAAPPNYTTFNIGGRRGASGNSTLPATGIQIAECAAWDIDLNDLEMAALQAGVCPDQIRPQNLRHYVPLDGRYADLFGPPVSVVGSLTFSLQPRITP